LNAQIIGYQKVMNLQSQQFLMPIYVHRHFRHQAAEETGATTEHFLNFYSQIQTG